MLLLSVTRLVDSFTYTFDAGVRFRLTGVPLNFVFSDCQPR